jgi:hypothetical protein
MSVMGRRFKPEPKVVRYLVAVVCATALLTGNAVFPVHAAPPVSATDVLESGFGKVTRLSF